MESDTKFLGQLMVWCQIRLYISSWLRLMYSYFSIMKGRTCLVVGFNKLDHVSSRLLFWKLYVFQIDLKEDSMNKMLSICWQVLQRHLDTLKEHSLLTRMKVDFMNYFAWNFRFRANSECFSRYCVMTSLVVENLDLVQTRSYFDCPLCDTIKAVLSLQMDLKEGCKNKPSNSDQQLWWIRLKTLKKPLLSNLLKVNYMNINVLWNFIYFCKLSCKVYQF